MKIEDCLYHIHIDLVLMIVMLVFTNILLGIRK